MVVSGNPARLLSVGLDGSLKVWSVDDEGPVLDLPGNADSPAPICLLRDQARAIVGRTDGSLEFWDLGHGKLIKAFRGHGARVEQIKTDGEEALAVTTSADGTVKVWDTARGVVCHELRPNQGSRPGLMVAQTAPLALTWAGKFDDEPQDTAVKVWSTDSGTLMTALIGHSLRVNGLALLDDDRTTLSWGADGSLRLWNTSTGQLLYSVIAAPAGAYLQVALSPDRTRAVSWAGELVRVWDVHHGTLLHDLSGICSVGQFTSPVMVRRQDASTVGLAGWSMPRGRRVRLPTVALRHDRTGAWRTAYRHWRHARKRPFHPARAMRPELTYEQALRRAVRCEFVDRAVDPVAGERSSSVATPRRAWP